MKLRLAFTPAAVSLLAAAVLGCLSSFGEQGPPAASALTNGWTAVPLKFDIQHPYDLETKDRYKFDPATDTHDFWVNFTDKPHLPPPNKTTARTEMRIKSFNKGEELFDGDVFIKPGTYACIAQVFDEAHGPIRMLIAHPDGKVTVGNSDVIRTNSIGSWWNLKMSNDAGTNGQIHIYVDNVLVGTYPSRGPRNYYFKCGVYSRKDSERSEALYKNIKLWSRDPAPAK